ncbi:MAG: hypothetical protein ABW167_00950 [Baekduia sp.]
MGLGGPSKTIKADPVRRTAPAPEPQRAEPVKEPAAPEREKVGA